LVTKKFLDAHPAIVKNLIEANDAAIKLIKTDPATAEQLVSDGIKNVTGKALKASLVDASFQHIDFTFDPVASSIRTSAEHARALGLLKSADLGNLFDLTLLNEVLTGEGQQAVQP
jgi:NitT/TauT family transport system substrate-binding protein